MIRPDCILPPMRILLVKTSSLGDIIHNLPVVSDIVRHFPAATIDWCIEESFSEIPRLHPAVGRVVTVALRRWRATLFKRATWREIKQSRRQLRQEAYDFVIDSQGLLKSALLAAQVPLQPEGARVGFAADSAREPVASFFYHRRYSIDRQAHAIARNRRLAAAALGYADDSQLNALPDYGIDCRDDLREPTDRYAVLLTACSREKKLWPEDHWQELAEALSTRGLVCIFPGGSAPERERAQRLAMQIPRARVAPPATLTELAQLLAGAHLVVGVDTGLVHLAAAVGTPAFALYVASWPALTGIIGKSGVPACNLGGQGPFVSPTEVLAAISGAGLL